MLKELECFYIIKQHALQTQMAASAYLLCLEKVHEKIHSKEYYFVKQSFYELEAKEAEVAKTNSILTVVETADTLGVEFSVFEAYQLPLTDLFIFNLSFF